MFKKLQTPFGKLEVFYDYPELTNLRVFYPRRFWQLWRSPVEDARIIIWVANYLRILNCRPSP